MERLFCAILLFIGLSCLVKAQDPLYWQLTDEDGLPSNTLYTINQDKKGFIWLGTAEGLVRFDGTDFKLFSHESMLDREIINMKLAPDGSIWFNNLGSQIFKVNGEAVEPVYNLEYKDSFKLNSFNFIDDEVIFGFDPTISNDQNNFFLLKSPISSNPFKGGKSQKIPSVSIFWSSIHTWKDTVILYKVESDIKVKALRCSILRSKINLEELDGFDFFDHAKEVPFCVRGRLFHYKFDNESYFFIEKNNLKKFSENDNSIITEANLASNIQTVNYHESNLYLFTNEGYYVFSQNNELSGPFLEDFNINSGMVDKENNLWLLTKDRGLIIVPYKKAWKQNGLNVSLIKYDELEETLLVGYTNTLIELYDIQDFSKPFASKQFPGNVNIRSALPLNNNTKLVGTDARLFKWDIKKNKAAPLSDRPISIKDIAFQNDTLWFATNNALRKVLFEKNWRKNPDLINDAKIEFDLYNNKTSLGTRSYSLFAEEKSLWIGTSQGLYQAWNGEIQQINFADDNPFSSTISAIKRMPSGELLIGTNGYGLVKVIQDTAFVFNSPIKEKPFPRNVNDLVVNNNELWIATNQGLEYFNLENNQSLRLGKNLGLPSNEIRSLGLVKNTIVVGTTKGLVFLDKNELLESFIAPDVFLEKVSIYGGDTITQTSADLSHFQNFLIFEFSGLGFKSKGGPTYKYRMLGLDSNWINSDLKKVQFPGLNPGKYEFQVIAKGVDGKESIEPATFQFSINPPWYKTWWFYSLLGLITLGGLYLIFQIRYQNIKKEEKLKREFSNKVNQLRMEALQTQMNPHFIFNAMNAIQHYLTESDGENAMKYLAKFARLIRLIFEQSKEQEIALEDEIELIELYLQLEKLRFGDKVSTKLEIDDSIKNLDDYINLPPLVVQPMIENAFRHGLFHKKEKGFLSVRFDIHNDYLRCTIEDNGIGLTASNSLRKELSVKNYRSSGINSTKERLAIHHNITIEQLEDSNLFSLMEVERKGEIGTEVVIHFKLFSKQ